MTAALLFFRIFLSLNDSNTFVVGRCKFIVSFLYKLCKFNKIKTLQKLKIHYKKLRFIFEIERIHIKIRIHFVSHLNKPIFSTHMVYFHSWNFRDIFLIQLLELISPPLGISTIKCSSLIIMQCYVDIKLPCRNTILGGKPLMRQM